MICLLDPFGCVLELIPEWAWWALAAFAVVFVIGVLWRLKDFMAVIHRVAGWPGVAAIVGAVAVLFVALWPKRNTQDNVRTKSARSTGKRRYNLDTNTWEDIDK